MLEKSEGGLNMSTSEENKHREKGKLILPSLPNLEELKNWRKEPLWSEIPSELKGLPWFPWAVVPQIQKNGSLRIGKPPLNLRGRLAKWKDPKEACTFEEAKQFFLANQTVLLKLKDEEREYWVGGIGILAVKSSNIVPLDFDHCLDEKGNWLWALEDIKLLDTYAEKSPSWLGVRAFPYGQKPGSACKLGPFEMYEHDHFLTVTGQRLPFAPKSIIYRQKELEHLYKKYLEPKPKLEATKSSPPVLISLSQTSQETPTDEEILQKALAQDAKLARLWNGNTSEYGNDDSRADLALCVKLAFWFNRAPDKIEAMFSRSALGSREKWRKRADYRARTIQEAITHVSSTYEPGQKEERKRKEKAKLEVSEPIELEVPEKKADILLPLDKIHPFFPNYWKQFEGRTETSKEYVLAALQNAFGAALGNKVVLKIDRGIRPNKYTLLLGDSTFARKNTGMDYGLKALEIISEKKRQVYEEALKQYQKERERWENLSRKDKENKPEPIKPIDQSHIYSAELTPEMLLEKMAGKPDGIFVYHEVGSLLARLNSSYMQGFKERLTDFFDGRSTPYRRETKSGGCITVQDPAPSLLACSTFQWLQKHLTGEDLLSGFLGRFVFVVRRNYSTTPVPLPPYFSLDNSWVELFAKLDALPPLELTLTQEASDFYSDWYKTYWDWAKRQDKFLHSCLGRLMIVCHKDAIINHCLSIALKDEKSPRQQEKIEKISYEQSFPWIKFYTLNIASCYQELVQPQDLKELRLLEIIRTKGELKEGYYMIPKSKLTQYSNMKLKELTEYLDTLEAKKIIRKITSNKYTFLQIKKEKEN
jgi:hypothetical protein